MSIEVKQAAQQALDAFDAFGDADDFATMFALAQKMNALRAAIQQATQPAEVTDEQIAACVKRASTYGLPFVGLLNPGGAPSDFSKRFTAELLAVLFPRPVQVPMTDDDVDAKCLAIIGHLLSRRERDRIVWRMAEAHHGITAQAKKEQA